MLYFFLFLRLLTNGWKVAINVWDQFFLMDIQKATALAEDLKELACKGCTKGWLEKHDGLTDPVQDIKDCGDLGLITPERQQRILNEIAEIKA